MADKDNRNERLRPVEKTDELMVRLWEAFIWIGLILCVILLLKVIFWKKDDKLYPYISAEPKQVEVVPLRGDILDYKGRALATSTIVYDVYLDTKVVHDSVWMKDVGALGAGLSKLFKDRSTQDYVEMLQSARGRGARYLNIRNGIAHKDILSVRRMPIFRLGKGKGGYIESSYEKRLYPYGTSARRTLGYVKDNSDTATTKKGIEGACDELLHGRNGVQMMTVSDFGKIPVADARNRRAVPGKTVRTTLDIDIQNIADEALRKSVERSELIEAACVVVLERRSGAVRALVNLGRDDNGNIGEWNNYAVLKAEAPGSVFKTAVVMSMLEEGYITNLSDSIPTYGGHWKYKGIEFNDTKHVGRDRFPGGYIELRQAFEMSANNPFRQLVCDSAHFGNNPQRFIDKVKGFGLFDEIDFDLKGATKPFILEPSMKQKSAKGFWDNGTLPRMAIGYEMELSPLNLVTFYNAIANDGRMMKPYLVEAILDEDGNEIESFSPEVMHRRICRKETADTLKKVMSMVTSSKGGTAYWQLHGAVCPIAGKTGTAQRLFRMRNGKFGYNDGGIECQQGSFAGFFPVEDPKFTAVVVIWSRPSTANFFGASYAAPVFREIADKIYCLNEY